MHCGHRPCQAQQPAFARVTCQEICTVQPQEDFHCGRLGPLNLGGGGEKRCPDPRRPCARTPARPGISPCGTLGPRTLRNKKGPSRCRPPGPSETRRSESVAAAERCARGCRPPCVPPDPRQASGTELPPWPPRRCPPAASHLPAVSPGTVKSRPYPRSGRSDLKRLRSVIPTR